MALINFTVTVIANYDLEGKRDYQFRVGTGHFRVPGTVHYLFPIEQLDENEFVCFWDMLHLNCRIQQGLTEESELVFLDRIIEHAYDSAAQIEEIEEADEEAVADPVVAEYTLPSQQRK